MITFDSEGHPQVPNVLWNWRAALEREQDVNLPGTGHNLRNYWVRGPGAAKIGWGTDGSFARCVANLGKYVKDPQGLCAEYHKAATGEWPAEKGVESAGSTLTFDFDPSQQRGPDGRWVDSTPISNTKAFDKRLRKATTGDKTTKKVALLSGVDPITEEVLIGYQEGSGYFNDPLRNGTADSVRLGLDYFDQAMAPVTDDVRVFRAMVDPSKVFGAHWRPNGNNAGLTWRDPAFLSTTTAEGVARGMFDRPQFWRANEKIVMEMLVPKGAKGIYLDRGKYKDERELLLARDSTLRIVEDDQSQSGVRRLKVEVIPPGGSTITAGAEEASTEDEGASTVVEDVQVFATQKTSVAAGAAARFVDAGPEVQVISGPDDQKVLVSAADKEPYGDVKYADPGYQGDGVKRYPIDTEEHIRAAWSYINQEKNASKYSADDLKKVKARIRAAMKRIGADVTDEDDSVTSSTGSRYGVSKQNGAPAMIPWRIEKRNGQFAIVADADDKTVESFVDRSDAVNLLRKLHAGTTQTVVAATAVEVQEVAADAPPMPCTAPWAGVLTVEGIESGDGRMFGANGLSWDEPPLPLMWQKETSHGGSTDKSVRVGSINKIWREADASGRADVFLIKGEGHLDLDNPDGAEVHRRMKNKDMRGNSVDVDSIKNADVELVYPELPTEAAAESLLTQAFAQPELTVYRKGRIRATTLVEIPAFTEARLELLDDSTVTASDDCQECQAEIVVEDVDGQRMAALTAASATIEIPDLPPREWFEEPTDVAMDGALTVTAEGRIYGFVAPAGVRHRSFTQRAQYVPLRNVDYERFHGGQTIVADGGRVSTGNITMDCGHATTALKLTGQQAAEHYDNTCSIVATVRVGENEKGVWVAGALLPDVDASMVRRMMACRLSGDWRTHLDRAGWREFVAALLVPVPGFPMARNAASVEISEGQLVASSVPVRMVINDQPLSLRSRVAIVAQRIGRDPASRREAAMARVRAGRVSALTARVESFHGSHDQSDHGNWTDKVKGFLGPKSNRRQQAKNAKVGDTGPSGGRLEKRPTDDSWIEVMPDGTIYPEPFDFPGERFPNT